MPTLAAPQPRASRLARMSRLGVRATRPAIVDLRFREDAWIVADESRARVCLGDYSLCGLAVTSFDVPGLNNLYIAIRVGQARRQLARRHQSG